MNEYTPCERCPFCNSDVLKMVAIPENPYLNFNPGPPAMAVQCIRCLAIGPTSQNSEEALSLWNSRGGTTTAICTGISK